jgi:hypothetical protein
LLANLCNSTIIEIYGDIIRVSHSFSRIDILFFIAESTTLGPIIGIDVITTLQESLKVCLCWSNM